MTFSVTALVTGLLGVWAVGLTCYVLIRWLVGTVDPAVDERQEIYSRLGGFLDSWQLNRLGNIAHKIAAINISGTIKEVRSLVDTLMPGGVPDEKAILSMLSANFWHQLKKRFDSVEDRVKLVKEALAHADVRALIEEELDAGKAK